MHVVLLTGWWNEDLIPLMHITADLRMAKESLHLNQPMSVLQFYLVGKQINHTLKNVVASLPMPPEIDRTSGVKTIPRWALPFSMRDCIPYNVQLGPISLNIILLKICTSCVTNCVQCRDYIFISLMRQRWWRSDSNHVQGFWPLQNQAE